MFLIWFHKLIEIILPVFHAKYITITFDFTSINFRTEKGNYLFNRFLFFKFRYPNNY